MMMVLILGINTSFHTPNEASSCSIFKMEFSNKLSHVCAVSPRNAMLFFCKLTYTVKEERKKLIMVMNFEIC